MRRLILLLTAVAFCGCDPGGHYAVRGGLPVLADGLRYVVTDPAGASIRVYGSWFTSSLSIQMDVTNTSGGSLRVRPAGLHVVDSDGGEFERPANLSCVGRAGTDVVLLTNETCSIRARYLSRIKKMQRLTVVHDGVFRDGRPLAIKLVLDES